MANVYAPQIPSRFDMLTNQWIPIFRMNTALEYGELIECVPGDADFTMPISRAIALMETSLKDFSERDYLLAIGEPTLIAAAAIICASHTEGRMKMLRWSRTERRYNPVEFTV